MTNDLTADMAAAARYRMGRAYRRTLKIGKRLL